MSVNDAPERSSRVDREIREILDRAEAGRTPVESMQTAIKRRRAVTRARVSSQPSPPMTPKPRLPKITTGIDWALDTVSWNHPVPVEGEAVEKRPGYEE